MSRRIPFDLSASTRFNANSFAGNVFWFDGQDKSKMTLSGSNITAVANKSTSTAMGSLGATGSGNVTLTTSGFGGRQSLSIPASTGLSGSYSGTTLTALHYFFVGTEIGTPNSYGEFLYMVSPNIQLYVHVGTDIGAQCGASEIDGMITGHVAVGTPFLVDYALDTVAKTVTANLITGGVSYSAGPTSFTGLIGMASGTVHMPNSGATFIGDWGEQLGYSVIKSGGEVALMRNQIRQKWGF